jgi:hypothetical protein
MQSLINAKNLVSIALLVGVGHVMTACAAGPGVVDHGFAFNALRDSPDVEILDYRYGESLQPSASNPESMRAAGTSLQRMSIQGPMKIPDSLYVKWRVQSDGRVFEDTVDLRSRIPRDITHQTVYFIVRKAQLYVYLVSRESRLPDVAPNGPELYRDRKVVTIYPDHDKR